MKLYLLLAFMLVAIFSTAECGKIKPACEEGKQKTILCHQCVCTDGVYVCKDNYICAPGEVPRCCPGQGFKLECNSCGCNDDGDGSICTLKACLPNED